MNPETAIYMVQVAESFATFAYALAFGVAIVLSFVLGIVIVFRYDREEAAVEVRENVLHDLRMEACVMGLQGEAISVGKALIARAEVDHIVPLLRRREFQTLTGKLPIHEMLAIRRAFRGYTF